MQIDFIMADLDWNDTENDLIVADYFDMLKDELARRSYNKSEHRRHIMPLLRNRSDGSVEMKRQNISAVLVGLGEQYILGYKPARRFQNSLVDAVLRWLAVNQEWQETALASQNSLTQMAGFKEPDTLWIGPPPTHSNSPPPIDLDCMALIARKFDVAGRDARNRSLGKAGEELILAHEIDQLRSAGRLDLADKVKWTSQVEGDGAGFDIESFDFDGTRRLIEVKTTDGWERTPFHITRNELFAAEQHRDHWHLIRVWNFVRDPTAFSIRPPLDEHIALTPTSFLANLQ
jgi:Domain of unknown function (DUF3883)